ncbi:hypothetical protein [Arcticibacter sp.]|uniref:hypothetical protein n=1 Tax=Arcticibacter sp. TaxID=1872630 RepID=UPI00388E4DE5
MNGTSLSLIALRKIAIAWRSDRLLEEQTPSLFYPGITRAEQVLRRRLGSGDLAYSWLTSE